MTQPSSLSKGTSISTYRKARNTQPLDPLPKRVRAIFTDKNRTYDGEILDGKRDGYGKETRQTASYEGEWQADKRYGKGTFVLEGGDQYEGEWANDCPNGQGTRISNKGQARYTGAFKDGKGTGDGTYFYLLERITFVGTLHADGLIKGTYTFPCERTSYGVFQIPPPKAPEPL